MEVIERIKAVTVARDPYVLACLLDVHREKFSPYQLATTHLAGAGKTYIAPTVIDSLFSNSMPEKLAYFYCNRAEDNRREPQSILKDRKSVV